MPECKKAPATEALKTNISDLIISCSAVDTTPLDAALAYASLGWHVLPLKPNRKEPATIPELGITTGDSSALARATVDPEFIKAIWTHNPRFNVGIATGERSGITVIDVDPRHNGDETLEIFKEAYGRDYLHSIPQQITVRGGSHFIASYNPELKQSINLFDGIDIINAGYIVAFPSYIENKAEGFEGGYIWEADSDPLCPDEPATPKPLPSNWFNVIYSAQQAVQSSFNADDIEDVVITEVDGITLFSGHTEQFIIEDTEAKVRRWAIEFSNARNEGLNKKMPFLRGRAQGDQRLLEYWCKIYSDISGLPLKECLSVLKSHNKYALPKMLLPAQAKKISSKRVQPIEDTGETIEQARADIYQHIKGLILKPDERYHLLKITTGLGKTTGVADVLNELHTENWPTKADGKPLRVLYLTDSKNLLDEFRSKLNIEELLLALPSMSEPAMIHGMELYEGRKKENCQRWEHVSSSPLKSKYCATLCNVRASCAYYHQKARVLKKNIVMAAKAAFLNDSDMLNAFDTVIIDESISEHIYKQITFKRDQLHEVLQAIHYAEISNVMKPDPTETQEARAFVQGLLDTINGDGVDSWRLRRTVPALSHETIEAIEQFILDKGEVIQQAKAFFSLFTGKKYTLRATTGPNARLNFAARQDKLIAMLKQKTVLHLDATPVMAYLKQFEPVIFEKTRPQNARYYQDVSRSLSKTKLKGDPALNADVNKQINSIIEATQVEPGSVCVFTYKYDEAELRAALPKGVMIGVYGRDGRGSNKFEHCTHFIVKGSYIPNIASMGDLAYLLNKSHSNQIITQHREAELLQVVGRARAATSKEQKSFFFLNDNPLPLDAKPEQISEFYKNLLPEQKNAETLMPVSLCRSPLYIYKEPTCTSSQPCGFEPVLSSGSSILNIESDAPLFELDQVRKSIQNCFDTYGFYSHDLVCFNQNRFNVDQEQLPEGISERKFKKLSVQILKNYPATQLPVDLTARVKVWGDSSKAVDLLTNTEELQQAIAYVRACYHRSPTELIFMLPKVGLSTSNVDPVKLTQEQDFKKLNWCILLYRYHLKNQAEQAKPVFKATSEPATGLSIFELYPPLNPSTLVYSFPWIDPGHEKQTKAEH